mmetsp:Transcript_78471/g.123908  ORF Transcript_78471/g.123908 Transcript_78471/m.123908 type:complete len:228 (-) Transcript_78471:714-1397(-)
MHSSDLSPMSFAICTASLPGFITRFAFAAINFAGSGCCSASACRCAKYLSDTSNKVSAWCFLSCVLPTLIASFAARKAAFVRPFSACMLACHLRIWISLNLSPKSWALPCAFRDTSSASSYSSFALKMAAANFSASISPRKSFISAYIDAASCVADMPSSSSPMDRCAFAAKKSNEASTRFCSDLSARVRPCWQVFNAATGSLFFNCSCASNRAAFASPCLSPNLRY